MATRSQWFAMKLQQTEISTLQQLEQSFTEWLNTKYIDCQTIKFKLQSIVEKYGLEGVRKIEELEKLVIPTPKENIATAAELRSICREVIAQYESGLE
jgi:hypothetical protein